MRSGRVRSPSGFIRMDAKINVFLYFSAVTVNLATFSMGGSYAWSSPAIPRLNGQIDPEINPLTRTITSIEESWLASLLPLGAAISAFISGYLSDKIGRKYTLLASSLPTIAGFVLLTFGTTIAQFFVGRFLCGLGSGTLFTIIPIYIGEIAQNTNRGALGCLFSFFITLGNLFFLLISPYITLSTLGAINLIVPIIFAFIFGIFVPESPYHYVAKKQISKGEESLLKFRGNSVEEVKKELREIVKNVEESFAKKTTFRDIYNDRAVMKALGISFGLVSFQQWSGINVIFFYMQSIFEEAKSELSSDTCTTIVGIVQCLASATTLPMADRFGRRFLLLSSAIGNVITLFISGIYFYLKEYTAKDVDGVSWLPILTINLFIASYSIGMGPISFTMIGELFPPHMKAVAATLSIFLCLFSTFCATNIFPYLKDSVGIGLSFCFFGSICVLSCIFVYFKVPETKGKSLQDIQTMLLL